MNFIKELIEQRKALVKAVENIAEEATKAAVRAAAAKTPPIEALRGTRTRSGELKAHWATDSITKPVRRDREVITSLQNHMQYASYVNDGHRMDRHFVPGLYVNPYSGLLEYDASMRDEVGIMVGTKTEYVEGLFMAEAGEEAYEKTCEELSKSLEDIIK